jgi:hypothetical protein
LKASPKKVMRGFFEKREERRTAREKTKYEINSSFETLCHVRVRDAVMTYEMIATATRIIIAM